ncbi:ImcF-related family protein [Caballeronia sp. ATUFL_M1_KS5A]|uniref:ImcF-related family protein n=1 Tax=Caballeronia sp. ATUFL_M1_KS5A TaxID=2921778 RepID=UPI0020279CD5|nr:ImcF-related family protein [Caballeronia sp. ATUFL_M1_KS5A]
MKSPIREYDKLEHGGEVTSGSPFTMFMGRRLARVGDSAQCDLHGNTTIAEGDTRFPDRDGQPYAMHRRVGFYWPNALAALVLVTAIGWCVTMSVSFIGNRSIMNDAQSASDAALAAKPGTAAALRAQLALQQRIDTLEYRQQHGAPWYLRAGLNHNDDILAALWPSYAIVSARNLRDPAAHRLEATLAQLAQSRADALPSNEEQQRDYNALKTYLMLAHPQHADAAYLTKRLPAAWPVVTDMSTGEWLDTSQRLSSFYASHLRAHPEWRLNASNDLTIAARNMLVNQIGLQNSDDTLYQSVLEQAKGKYADITLASLIDGADARGLFTTSQTVSGIYTRAAWDGMIGDAIDKAAKEGRVAADWVLADERAARIPGAALEAQQDIEEAKRRLHARYFADYTAAWQAMLTWESLTAGTRVAFSAVGDWAFLRLLGTANIKPLDSTNYALTLNHDNDYPLHYVMKTQVGAGPLDLLKLRGFKMPQRVFIAGKSAVYAGAPSLPPLPAEIQP